MPSERCFVSASRNPAAASTFPTLGRQIAKTPGLARRFEEFLTSNPKAPGIKLLRDIWDYGIKKLKFDADAFAYELAQGIIGDLYPVPDRMLRCCERIVHEFLTQEMCDGRPPAGRFDLFAVEGGTAAMCYIFDTLMQNGLLHRGDTIALAVPTFTPYIEIAAHGPLCLQGGPRRCGIGIPEGRHPHVAILGCGNRQACQQAGQSVLPRQSQQPAFRAPCAASRCGGW